MIPLKRVVFWQWLVSNAFLDGKDEGARAYIANQANLVGAIRLPNNAFNEAGTEVTTDIVFIQKRRTGQENNFKEWNSIVSTTTHLLTAIL